MPTKLDRLNELLKNPKLQIPVFRQTVSPSFSNIKWLRNKLAKNPECNKELWELLITDPASLLKPHTVEKDCCGTQ